MADAPFSGQLELGDGAVFSEPPRLLRVPSAGTSIQLRFEAFHRANPWVYDALVQLARDLRARGHHKIGIGMLFEVLRWQYMRSTVGDEFKLNNSYRSRYSRLIESREDDLLGVFEKRELKSL